jgi:cyclohexadieny/prephenate dehydrogenase
VFQKELFRKVTIVGVGMIGASLGMAMKKKSIARQIVGVARHEATLATAIRQKAIDQGTQDLKQALQGSDFIILAAPVNAIIETFPILAAHAARGCIVTDVGSSKGLIVDQAQKHLNQHILYVGSHPLAGSEKSGPAHANADLFERSQCIMTPTEKTNRLAKEKVKHFWTQLGANVRFMSPSEHDEILAHISHVPHLLAFSLMKSIPEQFLEYATQGLRDTTRVAASDPKMWSDILTSNTKSVLKSLDECTKALGVFRKAIVDGDQQTLLEALNQAKAHRERIEKS